MRGRLRPATKARALPIYQTVPGAFSSALSVLVPPAAAELRAAHPNLELELSDVHPTVAAEQLRAGEIDLAIVFRYDDDQPDDGLRYTHLRDDPLHLLSRRTGETLTDHRESDWIAGCVNCRREFLEHCAAAGFTPRIAITSDDIIVKQAFVAAGLGVTIMPGLALQSHLTKGVKTTKLPLHRRIHLATYGQPPDPPSTRAFISALERVTLEVAGAGRARLDYRVMGTG